MWLAEQVKQPACNLPRLAPAVLALFPVCQVRLLHVKELCPRAVDSQSAAQLAHRRIALLNPFPQQLRVSRIPHLAFIARRIRVHRVQVLHVRSPLVGEYALKLLYLQLPCKFHHYVVQQLIVRQWPCRIYYHVAEYLVVYVPFSCSISFGQLSPVYIFRNIRATSPSGVKNDLRPSFGLMLFLTRPKSSAISRRGSNFVSCPIRSSRKLNSRARKN